MPLRRHLTAQNVRSGRLFAAVFAPFIVIISLLEVLQFPGDTGLAWLSRNSSLLVLRLAVVVFSLGFLLELRRLRRRVPEVPGSAAHERAVVWHATLIPLLSAAIAVQQFGVHRDETVYYLGLIFFTSVYVLPPRQFLPILTLAATVLVGGVAIIGVQSGFAPYNNALAATVGAGAVAAFRFRQSRRQFAQDRRLEDQRASLAALNQALEHERNRLRDLVERQNEYVAVLAHDLKNPLSATVSIGEWLQEATQRAEHSLEDLRQETREAATDLRRLASSSLHLVEKLLEAQSLDAKPVALDVSLVALDEVVERVAALHALTARRKGIKLHTELAPSENFPPIRGDAEKLAVVIDNLVGNAVKYTPAGGTVILRMDMGAEGPQISVTDTGLGLLPEDLPLLFQRFQRLSAKPTAGESSTGLGLAIVKRIVDLHGGRVFATSPGRNQGTTFSVILPAASEPADPVELTG